MQTEHVDPGHGNPHPLPAHVGHNTTFSKDLTPLYSGDMSVEGVNVVMHQPLDAKDPEFSSSFIMLDWKKLNLSKLIRRQPGPFPCALGTIFVEYDKKNSTLIVRGEGKDKKRIFNGMDMLGVFIPVDANGRAADMRMVRMGMMDQLTRSTFSIMLADSGFDKALPELSAAIRDHNVLPAPIAKLRKQEEYAYGGISLNKIGKAMQENRREDAVQEIFALRLSKSQEFRRVGVLYLETLYQKDWISKEVFIREREAFFREDVYEDLRFVERTLRTDSYFLKGTFRYLFDREIEPADLAGSSVSLRYLGRGCNKQIYPVHWVMPDGEKLIFAVSAIRDNTMGCGDFGEDEICESVSNWQHLTYRRCDAAVRFGASTWHNEWRKRHLLSHNGICEVYKVAPNNIMLVAREFVSDALPLSMVLNGDGSHEEKIKAMEAAAEAYWKVWFATRNAEGLGLFLRTPRAEDVVMRKEKNGWFAKIIDMDTLSAGVSESRAFGYFETYTYYPKGMVRRVFERLKATGYGEEH